MTESREAPQSAGRRAWRFIRELAIIVVIALVVSTVVKTFIVRSFYIPSASMEQTLQIDDRIMVNQLPWASVDRGSIIVFDDPGGWLPANLTEQYKANPVLEFLGLMPSDAGNQLIKRVIGIGGDHVACCDAQGRLTVNDEPIDETYLADGVAPSEMEFDVTVPIGYYWVMGDNRSNSMDSRYNQDSEGGPFVPEGAVVGTVFVINWPMDRFQWVGPPKDVFQNVPAGR